MMSSFRRPGKWQRWWVTAKFYVFGWVDVKPPVK